MQKCLYASLHFICPFCLCSSELSGGYFNLCSLSVAARFNLAARILENEDIITARLKISFPSSCPTLALQLATVSSRNEGWLIQAEKNKQTPTSQLYSLTCNGLVICSLQCSSTNRCVDTLGLIAKEMCRRTAHLALGSIIINAGPNYRLT